MLRAAPTAAADAAMLPRKAKCRSDAAREARRREEYASAFYASAVFDFRHD
jgi:hypothetical protein